MLIGPAAFYAVVAALQVGFGWSAEPDQPNAMRAALIGLLPYFLLFVLTDGLGEEPGWRGFALPRMLERSGPMLASLVLGVMSALHRLPLFWTVGRRLYGESFLILLVELPAMSVLYTWVFQHTAGSALLAIPFHASGSTWWTVFVATVSPAEADSLRSSLVIVLLKLLLAAAVAMSWRVARRDHPTSSSARRIRHDDQDRARRSRLAHRLRSAWALAHGRGRAPR